MTFSLKQSGAIRRQRFELSVADFKGGMARGFIFWRGVLLGLAAGLVISYGLTSGMISRLVH